MGLISRVRESLAVRAAPENVIGAITDPMDEARGVESWSPTAYAEYAAKSAAVYSCVKLRADAVAKPRLRFYRESRNGDRAELPTDHPLRRLFEKVNPFWTRTRLWRATETSLSLWGQSFWGIATARDGRTPESLWWLRPDRMKVVPSPTSYISGYLYTDARGADVAFRPDEVLWMPYVNPLNEFTGLSPIAAARLSIDMGLDAQRMNRATIRNRSTPLGAIIRKNVTGLTDEQVQEIRDRWKKALGGVDNAGRVAVLWGDTDYKQIGLTPEDMQYIEGQRLSLEDVCRCMQVPPPLVADLERATYSNTEQLQRFFYTTWALPELDWILEEINESIVPRFGSDLVAEWDTTDVEALRENATERATREVAQINAGRKTINEIRRENGEADVAWGDAWWAPFNLMPVSGESAPVEPTAEPVESMANPPALTTSSNGRLVHGAPGSALAEPDMLDRISKKGREFAAAVMLAQATIARRSAGLFDAFFVGQGVRVIERLERTPEDEPLRVSKLLPRTEDADLLKEEKPVVFETARVMAGLVDELLPEPVTSKPVVGVRIETNGDRPSNSVALLDVRRPLGLDDPIVRRLFAAAARRVVQINDTTRDALRQQLAIAADRGYSRFQIANGVAEDGFVGVRDLVTEFYANRGRAIARTEVAWAANTTTADRYEERGVGEVDVLDGDECGWTYHDDPDIAHGSRRTVDDARSYPIAHPNCVRVLLPVV